MPWPPVLPPKNRTDDTAMASVHANDHNLTSTALADIVYRLTELQAGATSAAANASGEVSYTFPVPFKATPVVVAVVSSTSTVPTFMKIKSVTTTGFIARVFEKADNTFPAAGLTIKASWIAFNTAPGSS